MIGIIALLLMFMKSVGFYLVVACLVIGAINEAFK